MPMPHEPTKDQAPMYWRLVENHTPKCAVRNTAFATCDCGPCRCNTTGTAHGPECTNLPIVVCTDPDVFGEPCGTYLVVGEPCLADHAG